MSFRLTVVAGPNRGTNFSLSEGETSVGRQQGNGIVLQSSKVSKRHCVLVVSNETVVLRDEGSSNGTFVNGSLTKGKAVRAGDRISVGEYVLELSNPPPPKPRPKPAPRAVATAGFGNVVQFPGMGLPSQQQPPPVAAPMATAPQVPKDLKGRLLWVFEERVMPIFYGFSMKNEWRILCVVLFAAFMLGNLLISVQPLLLQSRSSIVKEVERRATFMARSIVEKNTPALAARAETRTEIGVVDHEEGVRVAVLVDLENRIMAPATKLNQYLASGAEAVFAVKASKEFRKGAEKGFVQEVDESTVVAVEPVKVLNPQMGRNVVVGMAVVSIDSTLAVPDFGETAMVYSETLILTGVLGAIILIILYRLTLKPFEVLNDDMDKALKGEVAQVTHEFRIEELNPLWEIINAALQRIPKGGTGMSVGGDGGGGYDDLIGPVRMFGNAVGKIGLVALDPEKKVVYGNASFEEISGIRMDSAVGQELSSVARDQALGAMVEDLFSRAMPGGDGVAEDFEFSGVPFKLHAAGFGHGSTRLLVIAVVKTE